MKPLLIDCDPGHDDALAILTALAHPEIFDLIGITTIGGNQTLQKVTTNTKNILNFVGVKVPLATGMEKPLVKKFFPSDEAHGKSGMDGPYFSNEEYPIESSNAVTFMHEKIMSSKEKVTLVALGPLTNIALLLETFPEVKKNIAYISFMGGGLSRGNSTSLAEFNIYVDPEAAHMVFHSGVNLVMSGLDVTEKAQINLTEIKSLENKGRVSHLAYELLHFYNKSGHQFGFIDSPIHDLCAMLYCLDDTLFKGNYYFVDVCTDEGQARGLTYADNRLVAPFDKNILVLEDVDRSKFVKYLIEALRKLDVQTLK